MKHITLVADVWELLAAEEMGYLEVTEDNFTGRTMVWVRRPPNAPGSHLPLTDEELDVLDIIFSERKPREGKIYSYGAWCKRLSVCDLCGLVFLKDNEVVPCMHLKPCAESDSVLA